MLEVKNINKVYKEKTIINDISFSIPKGSIVGFLGVNGSGKTTTLKIISQLIPYDSGTISLEKSLVEKNNNYEIMFLPDTPLTYPMLTGQEYIDFMSELFDLQLENTNKIVDRLNLRESLNRKIEEYSLGMKKKITLIPLLFKNPKILLLDEFISGIDPINMKDIKNILKEYVKSGNSVLLSTHQLDVVQNFCDYILIIDNGQIKVDVINIHKVLMEYKSVEQFFIEKISK